MCGIVGIVSNNKKNIKPERVKKALQKISHRGPDDMNMYSDDHISFGYVRLAIRGLDKNHNQPIKFDNFISFANGEVYSKDNNKIDSNINDLKPLIKDIINDEIDVYDRYDADFAISIYNKEDKSIILARDYFGVKPLFYTWIDEETLLFSSEIKGLFVLLNNNYEYDNDSILDYLLFGYPLYKKTIYKNIFRLEPRTIFKWNLVTNEKKIIKKELNIKYRNKTISPVNYLERAIKNRLISDRNVGAHLSGGYDSSLIAYCSKNSINYYSGYYNKTDNDYIFSNLISKDINIKPKMIHLKDNINLKKFINILDAPVMSTGVFVPYQIALNANRDNVRVLLAGQGSDELFLGYSRFNEIRKVHSKEELFIELINSDLNMINKLFMNLDIQKKYKNLFLSNNYLEEAQRFYIDNFLTELLHIEDHVHMNFSIENRTPYLGLDIVNFIKKYGINIKCNKGDIKKIHTDKSTALTKRKSKENMNKSIKDVINKEELNNIIESKIFNNFNYELLKKYIDNLDNLTKKEQYTIWFIYNINVWYKEKKFSKKITLGG